MRRKRKIWVENLMAVLLPMLIAVLSLGIFAFTIISRYIREDMKMNNVNVLNSAKYSMDLIMRDMNLYSHSFSTDPNIIAKTKEMMKAQKYDYDMQQSVMFIRRIIDTPVNTQDYLVSVYVYYFDYDNLICSDLGIVKKENFYDKEWLEDINHTLPTDSIWFQTRSIKRYRFEKNYKKIVAINSKIFTPGSAKGEGIITLNLEAEFVENMLKSLLHYNKQNILILNKNANVIFDSGDKKNYDTSLLAEFINTDAEDFEIKLDGITCRVFKTQLRQYGFTLISVVPVYINYKSAYVLIWITIIIIGMVILLSVVFAYNYTKKRRDQVMQIIDILDEYERNGEVKKSVSNPKDDYELIVANILKTFVQNNEVKMQLSKRKYQEKLYELKALQAQINPHFLYNTLETINWKVMELSGGYNVVNEMLSNLSKIMKYSLSGAEKMILLKEEVNYSKCYLAIQKIRYKNQYEMIWEYDEENLEVKVPKLIIQPLLENSFLHGIRGKSGEGKIKLKIFERNNKLIITVIDNGQGITPNRLKEIKDMLHTDKNQEVHIGLINTNQRLKILFGEKDYKMRIFSKENKGTIVTLILPLHDNKERIVKGNLYD